MENKKFVPKRFCGCISLRTGTIIIAVLSLLFGLGNVGFSIYLVVEGASEGWVDLVINVATVILAIALIHGIRIKSAKLVMVWVWLMALSIALNITMGIVFIFITASIIAAFILFVMSALQIYFLLVVRSYALTIIHADTLMISNDIPLQNEV
ncbi:hypothetical protein OTU49_016571 [Cherax quadricarinatus]|uniref:Uncharacterized protein n=1 Tax=Cherax quadricarinatus TaxID=27406 RepID=A0AAW0YGU8_CHEQU